MEVPSPLCHKVAHKFATRQLGCAPKNGSSNFVVIVCGCALSGGRYVILSNLLVSIRQRDKLFYPPLTANNNARPELAGSVGISHLVAHRSINEWTHAIYSMWFRMRTSKWLYVWHWVSFSLAENDEINQPVEFLTATRKSHENNKSNLNRVHLGQRQVQCERICYWRECRTKEIEIRIASANMDVQKHKVEFWYVWYGLICGGREGERTWPTSNEWNEWEIKEQMFTAMIQCYARSRCNNKLDSVRSSVVPSSLEHKSKHAAIQKEFQLILCASLLSLLCIAWIENRISRSKVAIEKACTCVRHTKRNDNVASSQCTMCANCKVQFNRKKKINS